MMSYDQRFLTHPEGGDDHADDLFLDGALGNLDKQADNVILLVKAIGGVLLVRELPDTADGAVLLLRSRGLLEPLDEPGHVSGAQNSADRSSPRDAGALSPDGAAHLLLAEDGVENLGGNVAGLLARPVEQLGDGGQQSREELLGEVVVVRTATCQLCK